MPCPTTVGSCAWQAAKVVTYRAVDTLEPLEMTPQTEAQWHQLAKAALEGGLLPVAERCYAAVGNIARARYLHQVTAETLLPAVQSVHA